MTYWLVQNSIKLFQSCEFHTINNKSCLASLETMTRLEAMHILIAYAFTHLYQQVMWLTVTKVRSVSAFAGVWRPLVECYYNTLLCWVAMIICYRQVWYRTFSLHYVCIQSLGIILILSATGIFVSNFISYAYAASIAGLTHGEKLHTQSLIHSPSLFDAPGTEALRNMH